MINKAEIRWRVLNKYAQITDGGGGCVKTTYDQKAKIYCLN